MSRRGLFFADGHFPFAISRHDQHGDPFAEWDGSTLFEEDGGGVVVRTRPSKSNSEYIPVYGAGSAYCLRLTLSQLSEWYWRAKELTLSYDGPFAADVSAEASAIGQRSSNPPADGFAEAESDAFPPLDVPPTDPATREVVYGFNRVAGPRDLIAFPFRFFPTPEPDFPEFSKLAMSVTSGTYSDSKSDSDYECSAGTLVLSAASAEIIPGMDVLMVGPDEFWMDPIGDGFNDFVGEGFVGASFSIRAEANAEGSEPGSPSPRKTRTKSEEKFFAISTVGSQPNTDLGAWVKTTMPVGLVLSGETITGDRFAMSRDLDSSTDEGTAGSDKATVSTSISVTSIPRLLLSAVKWWGYGGIYNEDTGAKV